MPKTVPKTNRSRRRHWRTHQARLAVYCQSLVPSFSTIPLAWERALSLAPTADTSMSGQRRASQQIGPLIIALEVYAASSVLLFGRRLNLVRDSRPADVPTHR